MTNDKGILIKNIYYMLSYAFQTLRQDNYDNVATEDFEDAQDLFAAILSVGVSKQLKQGLHKEYIQKTESLSVVRGKININGSIKNQIKNKKLLECDFDELSTNNIYNQIIKTTLVYLIKSPMVKSERQAMLKKIIVFFDNIDVLEISAIPWGKLTYQRNNKNYEMLMNICYLAIESLLQTTDSGDFKLLGFTDDQMNRVYEKFVLEYYRRHYSELRPEAKKIDWNLDESTDQSMIKFLPAMKTDIFLSKNDKVLIIDTKYYGSMMQKNFDKLSYHSANMYQIFAYVKNQDADNTGNVSGMLLYAKTSETVTPDSSYMMGKNKISIHTLDLNVEFKQIAKQLDEIVAVWLG